MPKLRRFRVPVAVLLGLCAAAAALLGTDHQPVETTTAVRVTQDITAGEVLSPSVLEEVEIDVAALGQGYATSVDELAGATLAASLPAGAVVLESQLVGPGLLDGYEPGTVAVPVRPADTAIIGLLSPGQRVDVLASRDAPEQEQATERVAQNVPVLWIPQGEGDNWLGAGEADDVVILAVDAATAEDIAQASHAARLHLSLVGPESAR
ncbi:Flp pilus assembly protein CpaB [Nesterenkonia alba]|uniref:Flp pilus assembly protein CpaB n=1 Tax=Nesterenkonia alba TaxID=515814 RepID=UPI0003B5F9BA|nr:Flp pilus assembly protein CpaB [Nesterenkonia alba]